MERGREKWRGEMSDIAQSGRLCSNATMFVTLPGKIDHLVLLSTPPESPFIADLDHSGTVILN